MIAGKAKVEISGLYAPIRPEWLGLVTEEPLEPHQPITDAHHHLWDREEGRYLIDEFAEDVNCGHRIEATVYVECRSMYRGYGAEEFRCIGEVEFAAGMAAMSDSGNYGTTRMAAAIVGHVDLRQGDAVDDVLAAMVDIGNNRLRGIRQVSAWDADDAVSRRIKGRPEGLLKDRKFREGFKLLRDHNLSFDAFLFHPQIGELEELARAFPDTRIVLNHSGGPIGLGSYTGREHETYQHWLAAMRRLAAQENVFVKLSGLAMRLPGFGFDKRQRPPGSIELAKRWAPFFRPCIELFGVKRCMFASNFPPDKGSCSYLILWNSFKRIVHDLSKSEKNALFRESANAFYRISVPES